MRRIFSGTKLMFEIFHLYKIFSNVKLDVVKLKNLCQSTNIKTYVAPPDHLIITVMDSNVCPQYVLDICGFMRNSCKEMHNLSKCILTCTPLRL